MLYWVDSEVVGDRGEREGGREVLYLHTDLLGQHNWGLFTLWGSKDGGASLQLLLLLLGVGQLETFLLLEISPLIKLLKTNRTHGLFSAGDSRDLDRLVLTFLLRDRVAHSNLGLGGADLRQVVADLSLLLLAVSSIASIFGLLRADTGLLLLALYLVVHSDGAGLCLLALLLIDVVADLIVYHLLCLSADSPHHLHTVLPGLQALGPHHYSLALPLYGGGAHLLNVLTQKLNLSLLTSA